MVSSGLGLWLIEFGLLSHYQPYTVYIAHRSTTNPVYLLYIHIYIYLISLSLYIHIYIYKYISIIYVYFFYNYAYSAIVPLLSQFSSEATKDDGYGPGAVPGTSAVCGELTKVGTWPTQKALVICTCICICICICTCTSIS